jgi:hypothetical protein
MVCDDLDGSIPERRVDDEEICQAEPEVFGPPEAGYQVQFLSRLVMTTTECEERWFSSSAATPCLGNRSRKRTAKEPRPHLRRT